METNKESLVTDEAREESSVESSLKAEVWTLSEPPVALPREGILRLPHTRQATNYTCGAAALQSVLAYYGDEFREDALAKVIDIAHS